MGGVRFARVVVDGAALARRRRSRLRLAAAGLATLALATAATAALTQWTPLLRVPAVAALLCGEGTRPVFVATVTMPTPVAPAPIEGKRIACLTPQGEEPDGPNNLAMLKIWAVAVLLIGAPLLWWARRRPALSAGS